MNIVEPVYLTFRNMKFIDIVRLATYLDNPILVSYDVFYDKVKDIHTYTLLFWENTDERERAIFIEKINLFIHYNFL